VRTVQGEIDSALERVLGSPVETVGAGRTDAGVHALGQVMSAEGIDDASDLVHLQAALNGLCNPDISVHGCSRAPPGFHARFSARSRTYVYAVSTAAVIDPWLSRTALHHPGALDLDAMNEAAGHLVGPHDFRSFGRIPAPDASAERILYDLRCDRDRNVVRIRARANAFIHQMVRSLVGTLIAVGEGRRSPADMDEILRAQDRAAAAPVAPPHGLCLVSVEYDTGWSGPPARDERDAL
jgi:tRNA pseudouridine38-40 synthase